MACPSHLFSVRRKLVQEVDLPAILNTKYIHGSGSGLGEMAGSCEQGDEPSGSTKCEGFRD
jgi:hypothetical protein